MDEAYRQYGRSRLFAQFLTIVAGYRVIYGRTAAIIGAADRGLVPMLWYAMLQAISDEGMDGNAYIRAEDRGVESSAGRPTQLAASFG